MSRGRLRIYLGAAPGVGKTYAMLNEGKRRASRGTDVVVGWVETHGRAQTAAQMEDLEVIPRRRVRYRDRDFEEMDLDAILQRRPRVALIDELAHTNVPGSAHEKRWQDVDVVLEAGINVVSTLNIQHLESVNDVVEQITGVRQQETIPDEVVRAAEQIELVDMTAEALRRRLAHGNVYGTDKIDAALANYFRVGNLDALREIALLWVADRVDDALASYRHDHGIDATWEARERVVVALAGSPSGGRLIRRAARMARRSHGDLVGIHVRTSDGRLDVATEHLESHRHLLEEMGGTYHEVVADDVVAALTNFARQENATQLVLGATSRSRWGELLRGSIVNSVIRASGSVDVHVISHTDAGDGADAPRRRDRPSLRNPRPDHGLGPRRRAIGWLAALVAPLALTLALAQTRGTFDQGSEFVLYQLVVVVVAAIGGAGPALVSALLGVILLNWYFTEPLYSLSVAQADNVVALLVFSGVGVATGLFVTAYARRAVAVRRANLQAEALARIAAGLVASDDPIPSMLERIRTTLSLDGVELIAPDADEPLASAGRTDTSAQKGTIRAGDATLALYGPLHAEDRRLLEVLATQLAGALEQRRLRAEAAAAALVTEADALRTAILRAVSHDLRTPLASIKASVSSLLQEDVDLGSDVRHEFLATIDEESNRLDRVIGDLLDASRLEAGTISPKLQATALEEVVATALLDVGPAVHVDVDPALPLVAADPGLLVRAVVNVVDNALAHSPPGRAPTIAARRGNGHIHLRVIDHGPGIAPESWNRAFEPFQRLGDTDRRPGVGLGLHVARGFIEAMHGSIDLEETAGGGLTVVIRLAIHDGA